RQLAGRYADLIRATPAAYAGIAAGAALRRERFEKRLAVRGASADSVATSLDGFARGAPDAACIEEDAPSAPARVAFVYSGNGTQWHGMGVKLLRGSPRFAAHLRELDRRMAAHCGFSIVAELEREAPASRLAEATVAQPLLFALQVAVTKLLAQEGLEPDAVAGHSVGEVAAAWACGAYDLEDAIAVICARSAGQACTRGAGRMAALGLGENAMRELLAREQLAGLDIAGINSPKSITVSGPVPDLARLGDIAAREGIAFRLLEID